MNFGEPAHNQPSKISSLIDVIVEESESEEGSSIIERSPQSNRK
jgi:hypothetical protein